MKTCCRCKESKPLEDFAAKNKSKGTYQAYCKECKKLYNATWYSKEQNRKGQIERAAKNGTARKLLALQWKYDYLLEKKCCVASCTNNNPLGLELDHLDRNTKKMAVSEMIRRGYPLDAIKAEAEKCRVICAYHHAIWTAEQMNHSMYVNNAYIEASPSIASPS